MTCAKAWVISSDNDHVWIPLYRRTFGNKLPEALIDAPPGPWMPKIGAWKIHFLDRFLTQQRDLAFRLRYEGPRGGNVHVTCSDYIMDMGHRFTTVASGLSSGDVLIFDLMNNSCFASIENAHHDAILDVRLLPAKNILTGSKDGIVKYWNISTGRCKQTCKVSLPSKLCRAIHFPRYPTSSKQFVAAFDHLLSLYDLDGRNISTWPVTTFGMQTVIQAHGDLIVSAGTDKCVHITDRRGSVPTVLDFNSHKGSVRAIDMFGNWIASVSRGGEVYIMDIRQAKKPLVALNTQKHSDFCPQSVALNSAQLIVSSTSDLHRWDMSTFLKESTVKLYGAERVHMSRLEVIAACTHPEAISIEKLSWVSRQELPVRRQVSHGNTARRQRRAIYEDDD